MREKLILRGLLLTPALLLTLTLPAALWEMWEAPGGGSIPAVVMEVGLTAVVALGIALVWAIVFDCWQEP